jgi:hypothetical protein
MRRLGLVEQVKQEYHYQADYQPQTKVLVDGIQEMLRSPNCSNRLANYSTKAAARQFITPYYLQWVMAGLLSSFCGDFSFIPLR